MRRKNLKKILCAAFLCVSMLISSAVTPSVDVFARTVEEIQAEQETLETEKAALDEELAALEDDIEKQEEYLQTLEEEQQNLQDQINGLNEQIIAYDAQITEIEASIADAQADIEAETEVLKERLKAVYMMGEASTLEILLNCESLLDFSEKSEILKAISQHDLDLISELKTQINAVAEDLTTIESYKTVVSESKKELETKSLELSDLYTEAEDVMKELGVSQEDLYGEAYDLEAQMAENQAEIDELLAPPPAPEPEPDPDPDPESTENASVSSTGYAGTGTFIWPCPGFYYLTSYWGDGRNHQGIDISEGGIYGAPVVAADSGVVTWAVHSGWGGGYGLSVWIDHGNGYTTRYGHFSQTVVNYGDYVEQGQVIGYVGNTGDSYGAHLHYEIRSGGVACDPMQWYY